MIALRISPLSVWSHAGIWFSSKLSPTQVHYYADKEQEWDIAVKCQWLRHRAELCQRLHNVFHVSPTTTRFSTGARAASSSILFAQMSLIAASYISHWHPGLHMCTTTVSASLPAVCVAGWPRPDSLFLLTSWHFLGPGFSPEQLRSLWTEHIKKKQKKLADHLKHCM